MKYAHPPNNFFNLYIKILGVTGNIGTEIDRKDLKIIYGVEIFKCPRHFLREKIINHTKRPEGLDNIFISLNLVKYLFFFLYYNK